MSGHSPTTLNFQLIAAQTSIHQTRAVDHDRIAAGDVLSDGALDFEVVDTDLAIDMPTHLHAQIPRIDRSFDLTADRDPTIDPNVPGEGHTRTNDEIEFVNRRKVDHG